jgi:hypothetical protein
VHETRSTFQHAMERRFITDVERLTGRRVARFISTHHVGPGLELELFLFELTPRCERRVRQRSPRSSVAAQTGVQWGMEGARIGAVLERGSAT